MGVSHASRAATAQPGHNWCHQVSLCWVSATSWCMVRALSRVRSWDSCERAATQPRLSDPAIKSHHLRLLTQQRVTQFSDHFQSHSKSLPGQAAFTPRLLVLMQLTQWHSELLWVQGKEQMPKVKWELQPCTIIYGICCGLPWIISLCLGANQALWGAQHHKRHGYLCLNIKYFIELWNKLY